MTLEDAIKNRKDCLKYLEGLGQKASPQNVEAVRWSVRELKFMQSLTLTPPNEWVNVENAFPPKNESVLCIVSGKPKPNITLKDAYQLGSWNKDDGWIIDEWLDWEGANVTWWMKLPETPDRRPPEGKSDA